jgi:hypothetical protein
MRCELPTPRPDQLGAVVEDLASCQQDGLPVQLHPGDPGWAWRSGSTTLADALRTWTFGDATVAIGFVDKTPLIRMAIAPSADTDEAFAKVLVRDLEDPARGVLDPQGLATPASNEGAVATYASAGFRRMPDVTDLGCTR